MLSFLYMIMILYKGFQGYLAFFFSFLFLAPFLDPVSWGLSACQKPES